MVFYLGTHQPHWLAQTSVPMMVSRNRLRPYRTLPRARGPWVLDSGAFTEISTHGCWTVSAKSYASEAFRYSCEVGRLEWAAIQDWMCEPFILKKTGKSIVEHQRLTVASLLDLRSIAPGLKWIPILQGWQPDDYLRHWQMYEHAGVPLQSEPVVGLGSVCRRGLTDGIVDIVSSLRPLKLHGFGVKTHGLKRIGGRLASADSMSWSFAARRALPLPYHVRRHKNCANCIDYALRWRRNLLKEFGGQ